MTSEREELSVRNKIVTTVGVPKVLENSDTNKLREEVLRDETLTKLRDLGNRGEKGYYWEKDLLFHWITDFKKGVVNRLVLPKERRSKVLQIAHDSLGHLSIKKFKDLINQHFTWPFLTRDCDDYYKSCDTCQLMNKRGQNKTTMCERPIVTEPFEYVCIDLVGPLPKSKRGYRYLLTYVCLGTRWPEALKSIRAKDVSEGLLDIFSRTGVPLVVLSDNGTQFTSKLMNQLCKILNVKLTTTTPYHPQSNGLVERLHATLEQILSKARHDGHDWEAFLPLMLFALRQCPNRDTGYTPYEFLYGRNIRTPLDVLYAGWVENVGEQMDVCDWVEQLQGRLETLRDFAASTALTETDKRVELYNRGKSERVLNVGDRVLCRIPGMCAKLEDSWEGPVHTR